MNEQLALRNPLARWDFTGITKVIASGVGVGMMDVDAVLHRLSPNNRFCFFEKKFQGETITVGEKLTLKGLALLPGCRSFKVTYMDDESIELREAKGQRFMLIEHFQGDDPEQEFGQWLLEWWHEDDE